MGGVGSTRWGGYRGRPFVTQVPGVRADSLVDFTDRGFTGRGVWGNFRLPRAGVLGFSAMFEIPDAFEEAGREVILDLPDGDRQRVFLFTPKESDRFPFPRPSFVCPYCGGRPRTLYLETMGEKWRFACRQCHRLRYPTQTIEYPRRGRLLKSLGRFIGRWEKRKAREVAKARTGDRAR